MNARGLTVRPLRAQEHDWLEQQLRRLWGSTQIVSRGHVHDAARLPALVVEAGGELAGVATFEVRDGECEIVTIDAFRQGEGIGSALLEAIVGQAAREQCRRVWLITTNDNLPALRFYQRRGLRLVAVHAGVVEESRRVKPSIPLVGEYGIPIRDELELELVLGPSARRPS